MAEPDAGSPSHTPRRPTSSTFPTAWRTGYAYRVAAGLAALGVAYVALSSREAPFFPLLARSDAASISVLLVYLVVIALSGRAAGRRLRTAALLFAAAGVLMGLSYVSLIELRYGRLSAETLGLAAWGTFFKQTCALAGVLLTVAGVNWVVSRGLSRLMWGGVASGRRTDPLWRKIPVVAARLAVLLLIVVPWVFAFLQVHRAKIGYTERPAMPYRQIGRPGRQSIWFVPAAQPSETTVVVCHGLGADQANFMPFIELFHQAGCNVVSFDFNGHGRSAGSRTTFGRTESAQLEHGVIDRLTEQGIPTGRLIGFGGSMGGMALLLAGERRGGLFDAVIIDSAYATLEGMARRRLDMLPGPAAWLIDLTGRLFAAWEIGSALGGVDATRAIGRLDGAPKLFFHCRDDPIVPFEQGELLYESAGGEKRFVVFEAGGHLGGLSADRRRYVREVRRLLESTRPGTRPDRRPPSSD